MKYWIAFATFAFALTTRQNSFAQTSPTGLFFDDEAYKNVPLFPSDSVRGGNLPWEVSLSQFCPTPGDQGASASCVGWALAHTLTIERAIRNKVFESSLINTMLHSAYFIYNQIRLGNDCQAKAAMNEGLNLLQRQGDCLAVDFNQCGTAPTNKQRQEAARYAPRSFQRLFDDQYSPDKKIDAIRTILSQKQPVIIAMLVPADFKYKSVYALDWTRASEGHAMVVVGYDDGMQEFIIMNSYGPDWGDGGFFHLNYYLFSQYVKYGYRLLMNEAE